MPPAAGAPPPPLDHRNAAHLLRQSCSSSLSALAPLFVASLLLFSFRFALLAGTLNLSSLADRDPSVRSLLSRLSSSPSSASTPPPSSPPHLSRRRPPFLHLTRGGALDDDFFSDPEDHRFLRRRDAAQNATFSNPCFLFLAGEPPRRLPRPPKSIPPLAFPASRQILFSVPDDDDDRGRRTPPSPSVVELRLPGGHGVDLDRHDALVVLYLLSLLSLTQSFAIMGFIFSYSCALGIAFMAVASSYLRRPTSLADTVFSGASMGIRRITSFVFLRWAVRDALIQFLCIWFFSEISDQGRLFKLFIQVKLMPFSLATPPSPFVLSAAAGKSQDADLSGFLLAWMFLDNLLSVPFAVHPWVLVMDHNARRRRRDVVREGFYLITLMPKQAWSIKFLETLVCGTLGRWFTARIGGRVFAGLFHSAMEVYFMVSWLVFYFAARHKDAEAEGRRFGYADLEDCVNGIR